MSAANRQNLASLTLPSLALFPKLCTATTEHYRGQRRHINATSLPTGQSTNYSTVIVKFSESILLGQRCKVAEVFNGSFIDHVSSVSAGCGPPALFRLYILAMIHALIFRCSVVKSTLLQRSSLPAWQHSL